jgi:toxin YoeB
VIIAFVEKSFDDYNYWSQNNKKSFQKNTKAHKRYHKGSFWGIGKPEPLRNNLQGYWSKRITDEHRLVYKIDENKTEDTTVPV